jgi:hypothetical protein
MGCGAHPAYYSVGTGVKWPGREVDTLLRLALRLRVGGAILYCACMSSWCAQGQLQAAIAFTRITSSRQVCWCQWHQNVRLPQTAACWCQRAVSSESEESLCLPVYVRQMCTGLLQQVFFANICKCWAVIFRNLTKRHLNGQYYCLELILCNMLLPRPLLPKRFPSLPKTVYQKVMFTQCR